MITTSNEKAYHQTKETLKLGLGSSSEYAGRYELGVDIFLSYACHVQEDAIFFVQKSNVYPCLSICLETKLLDTETMIHAQSFLPDALKLYTTPAIE